MDNRNRMVSTVTTAREGGSWYRILAGAR